MDRLCLRRDAPHVFAALSAGTRAVLVSEVR